jgi:PIN domain nuclease of toxin-antitoxin system
MRGYLLDTNILVAFVNEGFEQLPLRIRILLSDSDNALAVSVVSPWEISIKHATGKLLLKRPILHIGQIIKDLNLNLLPMTIDHALEVAHPEPSTKDPFDRLLLAVCACEGMKLVTLDQALQGHRLVY